MNKKTVENINITQPRFSVILPTYNRAHILPLAIKSVLNQTFPDFELIVSNSASTDNTREIVESFKDTRLRYFEVKDKLNMGEHYEFALSQAKGEYIIFFSDDDAFIPTMLEKLEKIIRTNQAKMIVFPFAFYHHNTNNDIPCDKNSLSFAPFTGKFWCVESNQTIKQMFYNFGLISESTTNNKINPVIGNIVFHHSIIELIRLKITKLFSTVPIDIYFIILVLSLIDNYYIYDIPLLVWSEWDQNSSIFKSDTVNLRQHYEKLLDGEPLSFVPLKFTLPINCSANAVLKAKKDLGDKLNYIDLDWKRYFTEMYKYLIYLQGEGINISKELEEFKSVLLTQPTEIREFVQKKTKFNLFFVRQKLKEKIPSIRKFHRSFQWRSTISFYKRVVINGEKANFNNVLESAVYLDEMLKKD